MLVSCQAVPRAFFSIENSSPEVGEEVFFNNNSENMTECNWDFGDGYVTNEINPGHVYTASGSYHIKLTVYSKDGLSDDATTDLIVYVPTLLEVEVLEYYDKYTVANASVIIYPSLSDWDAQTNLVNEGLTDDNGVVVFSDLGYNSYYLDIWEAHHNNFALRAEDVDFIKVPQLQPHQINRFTAYVDYVAGAKGMLSRDRSVVIKSLVPRSK